MPGHLPNFIIVGAQKAATTSLHYYLGQHPRLVGSRPKEVRFFDMDQHYGKGIDWYRHNFPNLKPWYKSQLYFEATPEYLYRTYVPRRIHQLRPDMRIIVVLREPVSRAFSAWAMYKHFTKRIYLPPVIQDGYLHNVDNNLFKEFYEGKEFPSFEEVIEEDIRKFNSRSPLEEPSVVRRGVYHEQVKRYVDLFGKENVLVLGFKDIIGNRKIEALNLILEFLGLPQNDWSFLKDEIRNKGSVHQHVPAETLARLQEFYEPHNDALYKLLGTKPNW